MGTSLRKEKELNIWLTYINEFFDDNRSEQPPDYERSNKLPIITDEVAKSISHLKDGNASGPDDAYA